MIYVTETSSESRRWVRCLQPVVWILQKTDKSFTLYRQSRKLMIKPWWVYHNERAVTIVIHKTRTPRVVIIKLLTMTSYREGEILLELHFAVSHLLPWTNHVIGIFLYKEIQMYYRLGGGVAIWSFILKFSIQGWKERICLRDKVMQYFVDIHKQIAPVVQALQPVDVLQNVYAVLGYLVKHCAPVLFVQVILISFSASGW